MISLNINYSAFNSVSEILNFLKDLIFKTDLQKKAIILHLYRSNYYRVYPGCEKNMAK